MAEISIHTTRICSKCNVDKPIDAFAKNGNCTGGRLPNCKDCRNSARRADYADDPTKLLTQNNRWRSQNLIHARALAKVRKARRTDEQVEADRAAIRAWHKANPERKRELDRDYKKRDPDRYRAKSVAHACARRARQREAGGTFTLKDIEAMKLAQKERCWYCSTKLGKFHIEHRIPLSRGGSNGTENIVLACPPCNWSKGTKMPWEMENPRLL